LLNRGTTGSTVGQQW